LAGLRAGMIMLADRNFAAGYLAAKIAGTGAQFLIRVRTGAGAPKLPVLTRCRDGPSSGPNGTDGTHGVSANALVSASGYPGS
jgi:hypothetical protein